MHPRAASGGTGKSTVLYGSWESPISAAVVSAAEGFAIAGDGWLVWVETRPEDGGKPGGKALDVTPQGFAVRSLAQEYGGGAFAVQGQGIAEAGGGAGVFSGGLGQSPRFGVRIRRSKDRIRADLWRAAPRRALGNGGGGSCPRCRVGARGGGYVGLGRASSSSSRSAVVGGVRISGTAGRALARAAWGSAGPPAAAAAAQASARACAGRWRGLLLPPPLPPFLLDHGVEAAAPAWDTGSSALTARSSAPRVGGGARGGACA
ncbi:uncharacterized protein [Miscanthus floridulus]|uniref:uncharacterized protein n=1 Tax=Miscanthus floridulus TaxID=154761 RepID=UPI0034592DDF